MHPVAAMLTLLAAPVALGYTAEELAAVTRPNGDVTYVYLDPDYFLEVRTVNRRIEHGVPHDTLIDYGDYEKVDGAYFPFAQESGPKGSTNRHKVAARGVQVPTNLKLWN
jgi:hypothetical protein